MCWSEANIPIKSHLHVLQEQFHVLYFSSLAPASCSCFLSQHCPRSAPHHPLVFFCYPLSRFASVHCFLHEHGPFVCPYLLCFLPKLPKRFSSLWDAYLKKTQRNSRGVIFVLGCVVKETVIEVEYCCITGLIRSRVNRDQSWGSVWREAVRACEEQKLRPCCDI